MNIPMAQDNLLVDVREAVACVTLGRRVPEKRPARFELR